MMNATRPAAEAAIIVVWEKVCDFWFVPDAEVGEADVNVALAAVFVGFASITSVLISVLIARESEAGEVPVRVASVGVAMGNTEAFVLAKSLMTVGEPSENTFESSLQHVLSSELQQYRSPPHGTSRSYELL